MTRYRLADRSVASIPSLLRTSTGYAKTPKNRGRALLVILGLVLELRARRRTGAAIRSLIGLAPKTIEAVRLHLTRPQATGFFWFSFTAMPLLFALGGVAMWWMRRT